MVLVQQSGMCVHHVHVHDHEPAQVPRSVLVGVEFADGVVFLVPLPQIACSGFHCTLIICKKN